MRLVVLRLASILSDKSSKFHTALKANGSVNSIFIFFFGGGEGFHFIFLLLLMAISLSKHKRKRGKKRMATTGVSLSLSVYFSFILTMAATFGCVFGIVLLAATSIPSFRPPPLSRGTNVTRYKAQTFPTWCVLSERKYLLPTT